MITSNVLYAYLVYINFSKEDLIYLESIKMLDMHTPYSYVCALEGRFWLETAAAALAMVWLDRQGSFCVFLYF